MIYNHSKKAYKKANFQIDPLILTPNNKPQKINMSKKMILSLIIIAKINKIQIKNKVLKSYSARKKKPKINYQTKKLQINPYNNQIILTIIKH